MKKQTPMQMRQGAKSDHKAKMNKSAKGKSAMERYADQRNASLKAASTPTLMAHDPQSDLYHLQKAAEVRSDSKRHRDAKAHARKHMRELDKIMKG